MYTIAKVNIMYFRSKQLDCVFHKENKGEKFNFILTLLVLQIVVSRGKKGV